MCTHIFVHANTYANTHTCVHVYAYLHRNACIRTFSLTMYKTRGGNQHNCNSKYVYECTFTPFVCSCVRHIVCMDACTYTYLHACIRTYTNTHIYALVIHTYLHTYIHTYIHRWMCVCTRLYQSQAVQTTAEYEEHVV